MTEVEKTDECDDKLPAEDGKWVIIQEWTKCSLKCNGVSVLKRLCIPPKRGGKPCEGEAELQQPCNTSCQSESLPVELTIKRFTCKPQRYEKCRIKEIDMMMWEEAAGISKERPVRVVMNSDTIRIFNDPEFSKELKGFNLSTTQLMTVRRENCFLLFERKEHTAELCPFPSESEPENVMTEWKVHFSLFKNKCKEEKRSIAFDVEKALYVQAVS